MKTAPAKLGTPGTGTLGLSSENASSVPLVWTRCKRLTSPHGTFHVPKRASRADFAFSSAAIGRLSGHGRLLPGGPANLTLYDPSPAAAVDPTAHASKSRNSPFAGMVLPGQVMATFLRGTPTVIDGKLAW